MNTHRFSILFPLVVLLLVAGCSRSAAPVPHTESPAKFMLYYYRAPDPDRAMAAIPAVSELIAADPATETGCAGFYTGVVASSPDRADDWRTLRDAPAPGWLYCAIDLGLSAPEDDGNALDLPSDFMFSEECDSLEGRFLATGDPTIPRRLIRYGALGDRAPKHPLPLQAYVMTGVHLGSSAPSSGRYPPQLVRDSLLLQAHIHPAVKAELEAFAREAPEDELVGFFYHPEEVHSAISMDGFAEKILVQGASDADVMLLFSRLEEGYSSLLSPDALARVERAILSAVHREAELEDAAP